MDSKTPKETEPYSGPVTDTWSRAAMNVSSRIPRHHRNHFSANSGNPIPRPSRPARQPFPPSSYTPFAFNSTHPVISKRSNSSSEVSHVSQAPKVLRARDLFSLENVPGSSSNSENYRGSKIPKSVHSRDGMVENVVAPRTPAKKSELFMGFTPEQYDEYKAKSRDEKIQMVMDRAREMARVETHPKCNPPTNTEKLTDCPIISDYNTSISGTPGFSNAQTSLDISNEYFPQRFDFACPGSFPEDADPDYYSKPWLHANTQYDAGAYNAMQERMGKLRRKMTNGKVKVGIDLEGCTSNTERKEVMDEWNTCVDEDRDKQKSKGFKMEKFGPDRFAASMSAEGNAYEAKSSNDKDSKAGEKFIVEQKEVEKTVQSTDERVEQGTIPFWKKYQNKLSDDELCRELESELERLKRNKERRDLRIMQKKSQKTEMESIAPSASFAAVGRGTVNDGVLSDEATRAEKQIEGAATMYASASAKVNIMPVQSPVLAPVSPLSIAIDNPTPTPEPEVKLETYTASPPAKALAGEKRTTGGIFDSSSTASEYDSDADPISESDSNWEFITAPTDEEEWDIIGRDEADVDFSVDEESKNNSKVEIGKKHLWGMW